ncbi:tyrosine-protein phosphatase [Rothia halotolerans]|uniref:tyrosine-protein phosphatase n=1 Tax=Rothia halotolerans TaxID=405770 RepID=UPI00101C99E3|nr:tyrosine-protein phosphatase [Rothia halotolerans]
MSPHEPSSPSEGPQGSARAAGAAGRPGGRLPEIATLPNLRDLGGHRTADGGRLRPGLLYRSVDLSRLDDVGLRALADLGIRTVYDLRTAQECAVRPDRLPRGARRVELDVLADAEDDAPAQLPAILEDPARAEEVFGGGRTERRFETAYRGIVSLPSARRSYQALFRGLAEAAGEPALFHCTTGKDRTGWAAASLLLVLGVDHDDVVDDYLRTNRDLLPALRPLFDRFARAGGDPDLLVPALGVKEQYLETALDEARSRYGGVAGYFRDGLGLAEEELEALREVLVETAPSSSEAAAG